MSQSFPLSLLIYSEPRAVMVGLHCCGDLASLAIKLFVKDDFFCSLNVMGCCYNLIKTGKFCHKDLRKMFLLHYSPILVSVFWNMVYMFLSWFKISDANLELSLFVQKIEFSHTFSI